MGMGVTSCSSLFASTSLQGQEFITETLSSQFLDNAVSLVDTSAMFSSAGLKGLFPSTLLSKCATLQSVSDMFSWNQFTSLDNRFGEQIFKNQPNLSNCARFLYMNQSLTTTSSSPVDLSKLFINNPMLSTCNGFLGVVANNSDQAEDATMNSISRRNIYLDLSGSEKLFSKNPHLTDCSYAFCKCRCIGVMHENIFGGVNATKTSDGNNASYSNKITTIAYCFHDSGANVTLTNNLFKNLTQLVNASAFVSGGRSRCDEVIGDISTLTNMFANNTKLQAIRRFFESTGVTGTIPSGTANAASALFAKNTALIDVKYLFKGAIGLQNDVPSLLFGNCSNINTIKGLFSGCTGLTGSIPGSTNSPTYALLKCLTSQDGCYTSLTDCSEVFAGCSNIYSTIPSNLFMYTPRVTTVASLFNGCGVAGDANKGIYGEIPEELFNGLSLLGDVSFLFSGCYNLTPVNENGTLYNVPSNLFSSTNVITNASGLFRYLKIYSIPADLFKQQTLLNNVSYMFNNCNRSSAVIPSTLFDKCPRISTIRCFAGESSGDYVSSTSFSSFPNNIFKQYSVDSDTGQKHITDVFCAFRNNASATGTAIRFDLWNNKPYVNNIAGCYHNCGNLSNISEVPTEYKISA